MQTLRTVVHLSFDAAAAFFYTGSIAIVLAAVTIIFTQMLTFGLATAAVSFILVSSIWGRTLWRRYRPNSGTKSSPLFAH